jgi:hypothetical protein
VAFERCFPGKINDESANVRACLCGHQQAYSSLKLVERKSARHELGAKCGRHRSAVTLRGSQIGGTGKMLRHMLKVTFSAEMSA